MKKYKNYIFVELPNSQEGVNADTSDGYLTSTSGERVKLPHKNYTLLGIADECINAPYAEAFSKDIVSEGKNRLYMDYELGEHHYDSASDSFQTLARKLNLKPTDYILRDESRDNI
jgi:hypothetical protein